MDKAKELETTFLAEMLNHAGLGDTEGSSFGSIGEDQFGSFLREAQARQMVEKGGIGLAESLFQSLTRMQDGQA
jgi:Rod binding domain-containing protein